MFVLMIPLFRNKWFRLIEMFLQNASKIAFILCIRKTPQFLFIFHFEELYFFPAGDGFIWEKVKFHEMKNKNNYVGSFIHKIKANF